MIVCDSQVHIWAEETPSRPWTPGGRELVRDMGHRKKPIGFEELKDMMDEAGVDRVLVVHPLGTLIETILAWRPQKNILTVLA